MRLITLTTCQWADMDFEELCKTASQMGYEGLEIATWGNFDLDKAYEDDGYIQKIQDTLSKYNLKCEALASHIIGQCLGDKIDPRHNNFAPKELANDSKKIKEWARQSMLKVATVANKMGVKIVTGFTGSPIWSYVYSFPQTTPEMIEAGFDEIVEVWTPILKEMEKFGIDFALEVHPGEIAFDYYSTKKLLDKMKHAKNFGINFDPSHLLWQGVTPHIFLKDFIDKIYHVHLKDVMITSDGKSGVLGSHLEFGDLNRGWNFCSLGHGDVNFEMIIRVLNAYNYNRPLSVEWEDSGMERVYGGTEAVQFVKKLNFKKSDIAFDSSIKKD